MKNDKLDSNLDISFTRNKISSERLLMGSIIDKYPVILDDGRTVVFISDKNKEAEIRLKYELLKDQKYPSRSQSHH
jgi:hypothetical protein